MKRSFFRAVPGKTCGNEGWAARVRTKSPKKNTCSGFLRLFAARRLGLRRRFTFRIRHSAYTRRGFSLFSASRRKAGMSEVALRAVKGKRRDRNAEEKRIARTARGRETEAWEKRINPSYGWQTGERLRQMKQREESESGNEKELYGIMRRYAERGENA